MVSIVIISGNKILIKNLFIINYLILIDKLIGQEKGSKEKGFMSLKKQEINI